MKNKKKWSASGILNKCVSTIELAIALLLVVAILVLFVQMIIKYGSIAFMEGTFDFSDFLSQALNLIIGIEFTRMLYKHTTDTIIDVLLFATARYLIIDHSNPTGTLIGVISIGILFLIRKYLMPEDVVIEKIDDIDN